MRYCKTTFVLFLYVMLTGCVSSQHLEEFHLRNIYPELPEIKVHAGLTGTNKTKHIPGVYRDVQETSPYSAFVAFNGNYKKITIHSAFVQTNYSNPISILKETNQQFILVPKSTEKYYTSFYRFKKSIAIEFKKTTSLKLVLDLSFIQGDKEKRNVIECNFEPSLFEKRKNYLLDLIISV